jgi:glycosyltransferase involved in cell wall biosynthesis
MPDLTDWIDPCGLHVRMYGGSWPERLRGYVFAVGVAWTLFKERRNYDIAYFLMQGLHVLTGVPVAGLLGKPVVMKFSCSSLVAQMTASLVGRLELRALRRWASKILILNPGMIEEAKEVNLDLARLGWMPNPVDTGKFCPCSREERVRLRLDLGISQDTPVVIFVGRLDWQKELPWLIGSFAMVVKERPQARLVLVGDGPLRSQITQLASSMGLDNNVVFTGRLDGDGVLKWLQVSDVFALVSQIEGLPLVVIEAMSTGLPSVLSAIPAHAQLVEHEVHGLLAEMGNQTETARGIIRLIDDPALRARMGTAARQRMIQEYSTPHVIACYEELFQSILKD